MRMSKGNFLLVSLEEPKARQLAEVLNNDTSRKIINYLSEHDDTTETKLAKELGVPLSTVHYNMQKLKEAGLVDVLEFHYSSKGREVDHYKLVNKYVIITPKPVSGIRTRLKNILPVTFILAAVSGAIHFVQRMTTQQYAAPIMREAAKSAPARQIVAEEGAQSIAASVPQLAADVANETTSLMQPVAEPVIAVSSQTPIALWIFIGGVLAIILYLIVARIRER